MSARIGIFALALVCFCSAWSQANWERALRPDCPKSQGELGVMDVQVRQTGFEQDGEVTVSYMPLAYSPGAEQRGYWQGTTMPSPGETWRVVFRLRPPSGILRLPRVQCPRIDVLLGERLAPASVLSLSALRHTRVIEQDTGQSPMVRGMVAAISLGRGELIPLHGWDLLRRTQTVHVAIVSGLHIGVVAAAGAWIFGSLCGLSRRLRNYRLEVGLLVATLAAIAYATLTGLPISALRVIAMGMVALPIRLMRYQPMPPMQLLARCAVVMFLIDPVSVVQPGAWLSLGLVALLLILAQESSGGTNRTFWKRVLHKPWALLRMQVVLFFGYALVAEIWGLGTPISSILINIVAVPLAGISAMTVIAGMVLEWLSVPASWSYALGNLSVSLLVGWIAWSDVWLNGLPHLTLPNALIAALLLANVVALAKRNWIWGAGVSLGLCLTWLASGSEDWSLEIDASREHPSIFLHAPGLPSVSPVQIFSSNRCFWNHRNDGNNVMVQRPAGKACELRVLCAECSIKGHVFIFTPSARGWLFSLRNSEGKEMLRTEKNAFSRGLKWQIFNQGTVQGQGFKIPICILTEEVKCVHPLTPWWLREAQRTATIDNRLV